LKIINFPFTQKFFKACHIDTPKVETLILEYPELSNAKFVTKTFRSMKTNSKRSYLFYQAVIARNSKISNLSKMVTVIPKYKTQSY